MPEAIYNKIGTGYNQTRRADPYITNRLFSLLNSANGKTYLDVGCGTGNYTIRLAEMGLRFIGMDPSEVMLEEARGKSDLVQWVHGYAENIPLPDSSIDGAIATLTIHHWNNPQKGLEELARILKPNGTIVIFTFTPEQEKGYWFNHFFPAMMKRGMERSMTFEAIEQCAISAGLSIGQTEKYFVQDGLRDLFGYSGKHDPERYFDPVVIKGISYFSIYATKQEVDEGLQQLRACIDSGQFQAISKQYENDLGDYLFVVLRKDN